MVVDRVGLVGRAMTSTSCDLLVDGSCGPSTVLLHPVVRSQGVRLVAPRVSGHPTVTANTTDNIQSTDMKVTLNPKNRRPGPAMALIFP